MHHRSPNAFAHILVIVICMTIICIYLTSFVYAKHKQLTKVICQIMREDYNCAVADVGMCGCARWLNDVAENMK